MSKSMIKKTIVALILIAIVIPVAYIGGVLAPLVTMIISALAAYEIHSLFNEKPNLIDVTLTFLFGASIIILDIKYSLIPILIWLFVLFVVYLFSKDKHEDYVAYTFLLSVVVNLALNTILMFYERGNAFGFLVLFYIAIAAFGSDTAAYFVGSFYGKNKLLPKISPNKTWEGSIGGFVVGAIASLIFGLFFLHFYPISLIITASLILPIVAQIGDLSFSAVKRRFKIKDFGSLIPGHGGILDRIDSLIFALLCFQCLLLVWF